VTVSGRPRRQRRLALGVLLAAVGLALLAVPIRRTWWGGWILAIAEAGIVGGLADWFAVTALFRRPLGLPIPHTALIPANWELMARRVGTMVGDRVLTREYLGQELAALDVATWLRRAAERVGRSDLEAATRRVVAWAAAELPETAVTELVNRLTRVLERQPVAPLIAWTLEHVQRSGWDRRVVAALAQALAEATERPGFRVAVEGLVEDLLARYRARLSAHPRFWVGVAELLGLINRQRLVVAVLAGVREVAQDPEHPLRHELLAMIAALPARLRTDPDLAARVEAAKAELLRSTAVSELLRDVAARLHRAVLSDLGAAGSVVVGFLTDRLEAARRALIDDAALRGDVEAWIRRRATDVVGRYHDQFATFIEKGVHALGPEGAVRLIEEHAGDDLQYIRVNGTIVGGLAGGAIYAVHLLIRVF
jgi:uncharacterized membrane-anchored protein YjiN (DUF445 family)